MFYADRNKTKNFYCKKYKYADLLIYKFPVATVPLAAQNTSMPAYDFLTAENKWGPMAVQNWQEYFPASPITNATSYWKNTVIPANAFE